MKTLKSTFRHVTKKLLGTDRPKQKGVMSYDLADMNNAAQTGDLKELKRFFEKYEMDSILGVTCNIHTGATWLHAAAREGRTAMMELMLAYGADIERPDGDGRTPLHTAAAEGQKEFALFLIGRGAKIDAVDNLQRQPLASAAREGHRDCVEIFLDKGAEVSAKDRDGATAFHHAIGHVATARLLLKRGADIDERSARDRTALSYACGAAIEKREQTVAFLLEQGARTDIVDAGGFTALSLAEQNGYTEVAAMIKKAAAEQHENRFGLKRDMTVRRIRYKAMERQA